MKALLSAPMVVDASKVTDGFINMNVASVTSFVMKKSAIVKNLLENQLTNLIQKTNMIRAFMSQIEDMLEGDTPRQKYQFLKELIEHNARAKGRIDFCKNQFTLIRDSDATDPYTKGYIKHILETLDTPI